MRRAPCAAALPQNATVAPRDLGVEQPDDAAAGWIPLRQHQRYLIARTKPDEVALHRRCRMRRYAPPVFQFNSALETGE